MDTAQISCVYRGVNFMKADAAEAPCLTGACGMQVSVYFAASTSAICMCIYIYIYIFVFMYLFICESHSVSLFLLLF